MNDEVENVDSDEFEADRLAAEKMEQEQAELDEAAKKEVEEEKEEKEEEEEEEKEEGSKKKGKYVPLAKHIALRNRAQAAEEALSKAMSLPVEDNDEDEDDYSTKKDIKNLTSIVKDLKNKLEQSEQKAVEAQIRSDLPEYDSVIDDSYEYLDGLTQHERDLENFVIQQSSNKAKARYNLGLKARALQGLDMPQKARKSVKKAKIEDPLGRIRDNKNKTRNDPANLRSKTPATIEDVDEIEYLSMRKHEVIQKYGEANAKKLAHKFGL